MTISATTSRHTVKRSRCRRCTLPPRCARLPQSRARNEACWVEGRGSKAAPARLLMRLAGFTTTRPAFEIEQSKSLGWLAAAHAQAEATRARLDDHARSR